MEEKVTQRNSPFDSKGELPLNWKEIAEELMQRLRYRKDYESHTFWLDSMKEREFLAQQLKEMFERFMTDRENVESPIDDKKGWYLDA